MSTERRLTLRDFSPSDPRRIDARADFRAEHEALGSPLFGLGRPEGACWTLTDGDARWDRPLACGGMEPQGHGRFVAWLYASDLSPRGWATVRRGLRAMIKRVEARRVEVTVRAEGPHRAAAEAYAQGLGLTCEGRMRAFGPDGADYLLFAGVF